MTQKCPVCSTSIIPKNYLYRSKKIDEITGVAITVEVLEYHCSDKDNCGFSWLPKDQEDKINQVVLSGVQSFKT